MNPMETTNFLVVTIGLWLALSWGLVAWTQWAMRHYLPDPRGNPYRRWCRYCGQCQVWMQWNWSNRPDYGWWEEVGEVHDPTCRCHKDSEYHG